MATNQNIQREKPIRQDSEDNGNGNLPSLISIPWTLKYLDLGGSRHKVGGCKGGKWPLIRTGNSQLVTRSTRHTVNSSHSQLVTGQLVTRSTRHTVNSSQRGGQLVTSKQTSKHQSRTAAAV